LKGLSQDLARLALDEASRRGASYADIRIVSIENEVLNVRNGSPEEVELQALRGFGVRVIVNGSWGFAASVDLNREEIVNVAKRAVDIARASSRLKKRDVALVHEDARRAEYSTPYRRDPFEVPLEEKLEVLMDAERSLAACSPMIKTSNSYYRGYRERKLFMSSEGSEITQTITWCGGGIMAVAVRGDEVQVRSYPSSFRGDYSTSGYEYFESLALAEHAEEVGGELVKLMDAERCPSGEMDLILTGDQLALQIHESCGHPTELDRVMGTEADMAGTSFLTPEKLGRFMYGSKNVSIVADATVPGGLGTFGYDDEGVKAKRVYLVEEGLFVGYQTSRETAAALNLKESSGGMRADSPLSLPIIRMTNINLLPGDWKAEEIVEETRDGILMMTNRSWSIDDKRINFQFGTEVGWRIRNGSREGLVKNPTYMGVTPRFWGSCDAVSGDDWRMWGTPSCGKGVPGQVMYVGHGCGTARFRKARVGLI
jgi:TldD protein